MDAHLLGQRAGEAATLLKALANRSRLLILCRLTEGELCVNELARSVGLSQSALSQHLARLRSRGLVRTRRDAQTIYYGLAGEEAPHIMAALADIYCPPTAKAGRPANRSRSGRNRRPSNGARTK
jgi:DNA-binding transcriptional ArsR family regulator